jgi:hypothetical protein
MTRGAASIWLFTVPLVAARVPARAATRPSATFWAAKKLGEKVKCHRLGPGRASDILNQRGVESDLGRQHDKLTERVMIVARLRFD